MIGYRAGFVAGLAMLAASLLAGRPASRVSQIDYLGWQDCWQITNGGFDLVYVPQTARIMRYGLVGKPNVLWTNPELAGKLVSPKVKEWTNFGGDKLWPAPQADWGWPPDSVLDRGVARVRPLENGLAIRGLPSGGLRLDREIRMGSDGTVRMMDRLTNVSAKPVRKSVWEICQADDPDSASLPIDGGAASWTTLQGVDGDSFCSTGPTTLHIRRDARSGHKFGSYSPGGYVSAVKGGQTFTMSMKVVYGAKYPDGGCPQQVYTSADPGSYMELELLGPIETIEPGKSTEIRIEWKLK